VASRRARQSRGKMVMAVLGHPLLAGGRDVAEGDEGFMIVRQMLREYGVPVVMAGDTHDLEYYSQPADGPSGPVTVHHWVNGGGGAYLSFGTSLAWPVEPVTSHWAYYPSRLEVVDKIQADTPWWKRPAWLWTRHLDAWPFSPEWLSAMFNYNVAPFFQSFVVVSVDPARRTLTVRPWEFAVRSPGTTSIARPGSCRRAPRRTGRWNGSFSTRRPHVDFSVDPETVKWATVTSPDARRRSRQR